MAPSEGSRNTTCRAAPLESSPNLDTIFKWLHLYQLFFFTAGRYLPLVFQFLFRAVIQKVRRFSCHPEVSEMQKTTADGHRCPRPWDEKRQRTMKGAAHPPALAQTHLPSPVDGASQKSSPLAFSLCDDPGRASKGVATVLSISGIASLALYPPPPLPFGNQQQGTQKQKTKWKACKPARGALGPWKWGG